jgi:hypothetical protein
VSEFDNLNPPGIAFGCDHCADWQNRNFGHVTQIRTDPDRGMILIKCPTCGTLYENSVEGEDLTRRLEEVEARIIYPGSF